MSWYFNLNPNTVYEDEDTLREDVDSYLDEDNYLEALSALLKNDYPCALLMSILRVAPSDVAHNFLEEWIQKAEDICIEEYAHFVDDD